MSDIHDFTGGRGQRASSCRFELLDKGNSLIGSLDVDSTSTQRVSNRINRTVKRTLSGLRLPPTVTADVDTLTDRVRPVLLYEDGTEYPMGVFLFADASRSLMLSSGGYYQAVGEGWWTDGTCVDQLATLNQGSLGINFYRAGQRVEDALVQQLDVAGVTDYEMDATDAVFGQPVVWKPNEKRLTIINDLARLAGFYSLYFDGWGVGQLRKVPSLESVDPTIEYRLGTIYADSIVVTDDTLNAPNVYVAVNTAMTERPIWGQWRVPAEAPHSFENRGFWVTKEIDAEGAESSAAASAMARAFGKADYSAYRWVNFNTPVDGRHGTFDVFRYLDGDKYRSQGWETDLSPDGSTSVEGRRVWSDSVADLLIEGEDGGLD